MEKTMFVTGGIPLSPQELSTQEFGEIPLPKKDAVEQTFYSTRGKGGGDRLPTPEGEQHPSKPARKCQKPPNTLKSDGLKG